MALVCSSASKLDSIILQPSTSTIASLPVVLNSPSGEKFRICCKTGTSVCRGINITSGEDREDEEDVDNGKKVAVKFEAINLEHHRLEHEAHVYNSLAGGVGIPFVHCFIITEEYKFSVLDLLGPNLEDLFTFCDRKLTLKTVLLVADQLISRIESIHSRSWIHHDIKPESLAMGKGKFGNQVHIIKYGRAKRSRPITHSHFYWKDGKVSTGSPNANLCTEPSYRGDLESLGYVMLYFFHGDLTWQDLKTKPTEYLFRGLPEEFATYFYYIRNLRFDEKPDYSYLKRIFSDLFLRMGFQKDYSFDWTIRKFQKLAQKKAQAVVEPIDPQSAISASSVPTSSKKTSVSEGATSNIPQPETRPISQDQIIAEVKGIYTGLLMVEAKCIEVDEKQAKLGNPKLSSEQWQARIYLRRVMFFEFHDFILASQHPAASQRLHELASKLELPTRMWRSIQALLHVLFLQLHRDRLPESRANFLSYFRLAYQVMALLYETAPELKSAWIECLYALAYYRMLTEDPGTRDRGVWEYTCCYWKSLRHPSARSFLQADFCRRSQSIVSLDMFLDFKGVLGHIENVKFPLAQKDSFERYPCGMLLDSALSELSAKSLSRWYLAPVLRTCCEIFVAAASLTTMLYTQQHQARVSSPFLYKNIDTLADPL
jgi:casein kinase I homolog HRR25